MKHPSVIAAIVVGVSLIISASILSFALLNFRIRLQGGNSPVYHLVDMTP